MVAIHKDSELMDRFLCWRNREETAAAKSTNTPQQQQPRSELDRVEADQFEDAPPRTGLGFGAASASTAGAGLGSVPSDRRSHDARATSSSNGSSAHEPTVHRAAASAPAQQRGCVVLLQNMVGPGEVDDELQDEVKEECEAKYGRVTACVVYEVPSSMRVPPEQAVRIFVQFERPGDAEKGASARSVLSRACT